MLAINSILAARFITVALISIAFVVIRTIGSNKRRKEMEPGLIRPGSHL